MHRGFEGNGYWAVRVAQTGNYEITLRRWPIEVDAPITAAVDGRGAIAAETARLRVGEYDEQKQIAVGEREVVFHARLPAGSTRLETWLRAGDSSRGAYYVRVRFIDAE